MVSTNRSNLLFLAQRQFIRSSVANVMPRSLSGEADVRNYFSTAVNFDFEDHVISCPCFTPGTFGATDFLSLSYAKVEAVVNNLRIGLAQAVLEARA